MNFKSCTIYAAENKTRSTFIIYRIDIEFAFKYQTENLSPTDRVKKISTNKKYHIENRKCVHECERIPKSHTCRTAVPTVYAMPTCHVAKNI